MVTEGKNAARARWLVGLAGACALGFALGQVCPRPADARILRSLQKSALGVDEVAAQLAALREHGRSAATATQCLDANELASKLQDVICENSRNRAATSRSPVSAPHEPEPLEAKETEESLAIYDHARAVVDSALRAKSWTDGDLAELRRSTPKLSPDQGEEVTRTLVQAINRGELAIKTSGPPL
jgi:hypothetical protein